MKIINKIILIIIGGLFPSHVICTVKSAGWTD